MKKGILIIFFLIVFLVFCMGDNIYLKNGTKLVGKVMNFGEVSVDVLLETGKIVTIMKDDIIRIDPLDSQAVQQVLNTSVGSQYVTSDVPSGYDSWGYFGMTPILGPSSDDIPVMFGDPEIEMRKRLLMYQEMKKESWVAAELSLLIPSAGHLYTGEWERGFLFLGSRAAFAGLMLYGFSTHNELDQNPSSITYGEEISVANNTTIAMVAAGGFALFTLLEFVDSYYSAERYNQVLRMRLGIEKFDPMMLPTFGK